MRRLQVTHVFCHQQMLSLTPDCYGAELVQDSGGWIGRQQRGMLRAFGGVELCKSKWMRGYNPHKQIHNDRFVTTFYTLNLLQRILYCFVYLHTVQCGVIIMFRSEVSSSDGDLQAEDWQQAAVLGKPHKSRRLPISCSLWTWSHISRNSHQC